MSKLEILYNSECPICNREIEHYKKLPSDGLTFTPITPDTLRDWGMEEDQAAMKLHARFEGQEIGGQTIEGVEAFMALWARLPYYHPLAKLLRIKPLKVVSEAIYGKLLAPLLFRMHKSRQAKERARNP